VLDPLPAAAAWRHVDTRDGFETTFFTRRGSDTVIEGHTTAVEDGVAWAVRYAIVVDDRWCARSATIEGRTAKGACSIVLQALDVERWQVDGRHRPELDGCLDIDLESSACTNTLPIQRLRPDVGQHFGSPAAYVRASDLSVMRLDQDYRRLDSVNGLDRFWYYSPSFDFECELAFDAAGLIIDYPGIAHRVL
jgi:uncharacterized protein